MAFYVIQMEIGNATSCYNHYKNTVNFYLIEAMHFESLTVQLLTYKWLDVLAYSFFMRAE